MFEKLVSTKNSWRGRATSTSRQNNNQVASPLKSFTIAALSIATLASSSQAVDLKWRPLGAPGVGGHVTTLEVSPHDSNLVLVGGDMLGLAYSLDGGQTWEDGILPKGDATVGEFTFHPTDENIIWAAMAAGPMKSTDKGKTWTKKRSGFPSYVFAKFDSPVQKILIDPDDSTRMLAFTGNHRGFGTRQNRGKVYVSTDSGESWTLLSTISNNKDVNTAVYKPGSGNTIYAALSDGFYVSTDDGATWSKKDSNNTRWVTASATTGSTLWVARKDLGIYKSTDSGNTFTAVNSGLSTGSGHHYHFVESAPSNPDVLYTADKDGQNMYKSTNGGTSWTTTNSLGSSPYAKYKNPTCGGIDPTDANKVLVGTPTTVWRSTNGGSNWTDVSSVSDGNGGWIGNGFYGEVTNVFKINPFYTDISMYGAMDDGKWISKNNFGSWKHGGEGAGKGLDRWNGITAMSFTNTNNVYYVAQGQWGNGIELLKTSNGGSSWSNKTLPGTSGHIDDIYAHPTDTAKLWVIRNGNIYYSSDSGSNWTEVGSNVGSANCITGDATGTNPLHMYVGANGLWESTDGTNFTKISGGPGTVTEVKLHPTNDDYVYAIFYKATTDSNAGIWRYNHGTSGWWQITKGDGSKHFRRAIDVTVDPNNASRLVAATDMDPSGNNTGESGIYISENNGSNWTAVNTGLPIQRVTTIDFHPDASGIIVAGTNGSGPVVSSVNIAEAPTSLVATVVSETAIDLDWTDNSLGEFEFVIEYKEGSGSFTELTRVPSNVTSIEVTDLTAGTQYTFRVLASNGAGDSAWSNEAIESTSGGSGGGTQNLLPSKDSFVRGGSYDDDNYGTNTTVIAKESTSANYDRKIYVQFDLSSVSGTVSDASLTFDVANISANVTAKIYQVDTDSWTETGITWNNKPSTNGLIESFSVNTSATSVTFNVTDYVNAQAAGDDVVSFQIAINENATFSLSSRESTIPPVLSVTTAAAYPSEIVVAEDARVRGGTYANNNYGANTVVEVKNRTGSNDDYETFLKFDLSSLPGSVTNATLSLIVDSQSQGPEISIYQVDTDTWDELTITWNNKPSSGTLIETFDMHSTTTEVQFDVTAYINAQQSGDGVASFRIKKSHGSQWVRFESKEGTNAPLLLITE